jgi:general secretion pathway protein E
MIPAAILHKARSSDKRMIEAVEDELHCTPGEFVTRLAEELHMPAASLDDLRQEAPAFDLIPYEEASRRGCVALRDGDGDVSVVLGDPYDLDSQDWIEARFDAMTGEKFAGRFRYRIAHRLDLGAYLAQQETGLRALDGISSGLQNEISNDGMHEISFESAAQEDSTVVRLVTSTLYDALKAGASDVHLETTARGLTIKYRIDGVLTAAQSMQGVDLAEQVISRIKVMSELDIAERRVPQDGRFKARRDGRDIDFRVSVMPSVHGEDAVLRILDRRALSDQLSGLTLEALGFEADLKKRLRAQALQPYGMLLATGPTGSGKTTTLYALISETNKGEDKFVTIEDPVEYQLPGVLQIPVNEQKGLTFARGLRSILRHDPDRIMVGEIRDPETAEIAVQSALTGHLVYTTVHANNTLDVLGRFQHMGVDTYNFVSALNAVLAQRLIRTICVACKKAGCPACRGTGFKGRKAIGELLVMNDELRELIVARAPARTLKEAARAAGSIPLRETALALVDAGETTLEEINRVTFVA